MTAATAAAIATPSSAMQRLSIDSSDSALGDATSSTAPLEGQAVGDDHQSVASSSARSSNSATGGESLASAAIATIATSSHAARCSTATGGAQRAPVKHSPASEDLANSLSELTKKLAQDAGGTSNAHATVFFNVELLVNGGGNHASQGAPNRKFRSSSAQTALRTSRPPPTRALFRPTAALRLRRRPLRARREQQCRHRRLARSPLLGARRVAFDAGDRDRRRVKYPSCPLVCPLALSSSLPAI